MEKLIVQPRCGVKNSNSRVVGGSTTRPNEWPWMVQIINKKYGPTHHFCGGSLISPEWLVTATHCLNRWDKSDFKFVLAEHDRFTNEGSEQVFTAKKIILRDDYNSPSAINNDIALVQLDRPAILNGKVGTVCLPHKDYQIPVNSFCVTAGWGLTSGGGKQSRYLKHAYMPIASTTACRRVHSSEYKEVPVSIIVGDKLFSPLINLIKYDIRSLKFSVFLRVSICHNLISKFNCGVDSRTIDHNIRSIENGFNLIY
eukprot:gene20315-22314_t